MAKKRYHGGGKPMSSRPRTLTKQEKINALLKNGITPEDLEKIRAKYMPEAVPI